MSIRTALLKVLHVAPTIEMQHATNLPDNATSNATLSAITISKASSDADRQATSSATVAQQSVESDATLTDRNGGTAWMWQVFLPDRTLIVTTMPASTIKEMNEMYPAARKIEGIE